MSECVFCRIIAGQIPAARLLETAKAVAILDVNPVNRGHALIMPKRHAQSLLELMQDELHSCMSMVQRVARAVTEVTQCPGFNVLQNNHECAGQVVAHVHFHVIPRKPDDGFVLGWRQGSYREGEIERLGKQIHARL